MKTKEIKNSMVIYRGESVFAAQLAHYIRYNLICDVRDINHLSITNVNYSYKDGWWNVEIEYVLTVEDNSVEVKRVDSLDAMRYALCASEMVKLGESATKLGSFSVDEIHSYCATDLKATREVLKTVKETFKSIKDSVDAVKIPTVSDLSVNDWTTASLHYRELKALNKKQGYITITDFYTVYGYDSVGGDCDTYGWIDIYDRIFYDTNNHTVTLKTLPVSLKDIIPPKYSGADVVETRDTGNWVKFTPEIIYSTKEAANYFKKALNQKLFNTGKLTLNDYTSITEIGTVFGSSSDHGWSSKGLKAGFYIYENWDDNWVLAAPEGSEYIDFYPKPASIAHNVTTTSRYVQELRTLLVEKFAANKFVSIRDYYDICGIAHGSDDNLKHWGWIAGANTAAVVIKTYTDYLGRNRHSITIDGPVVRCPGDIKPQDPKCADSDVKTDSGFSGTLDVNISQVDMYKLFGLIK